MSTLASNPEELLTQWHRRLRETQFCHYEAAKPLFYANYCLGIPVIALTTFIGTSVFATLEKQVDLRIRLVVAITSVIAAVLASLQTFLRFTERAEKHRTIAAQAGSIRREVELLLATKGNTVLEAERLDSIRNQVDKLAQDAPSIPEWVWKKARKLTDKP